MKLLNYLFSLLLFISLATAQQTNYVNIGVMSEFPITSVWISAAQGSYFIYADNNKIYTINGKGSIHVSKVGDSLLVKTNGDVLATCKKVKMVGKDAPNSFNIKCLQPALPERTYDDNLEIRPNGKGMKLINRVNIDHYVAGVVEAENGISQNFEYYKMKSIICRTYALSNPKRHEAEGFQLCDKVHCQVYKGKNKRNDDILMAAVATTGIVIVDSNIKLITAAFHSNCGGQTMNSEDVWALPTSYLKSVKDTFCLNKPQARWETTITKKDWLTYLTLKHKCDLTETLHTDCYTNYEQPHRESELITHDLKIPFKKLRTDFNLRSGYFSLEDKGDSIKIIGRGFGHGLGLCQEGAMRMSELGYKYNQILHFYYKDIHLVDLSVLDFFKD
jgi:stage II sporulation protein D